MKKFLLALAILIPILAHSQSTYILKKDGTKLYIRSDASYYSTFGSMKYYLPENGLRSEKKIDLDDIDKVISPTTTFIPAKLSGKTLGIFKVVAESAEKRLLVNYLSGLGRPYESYNYQIVDKDGRILESGKFQDKGDYIKSHAENQKKAAVAIKKHFPNCTEMLTKLDEYEKKSPEIVNFFYLAPTYNCN